MYRIGHHGVEGLRVYDLADPSDPQFVGAWPGKIHDAQVITYTSGPYAGRQIAFACANQPDALHIIDVTDKQNIFLVKEVLYPNASLAHQVWLSEDLQYAFLNDEGDHGFGLPSTTRVFDVSNLNNAFSASAFDNGNPAITHDCFVKGDALFCANRTSGLRIFDISNPLVGVEMGWYDTWPVDDSLKLWGLKGVCPFFDSGIVVGTSSQNGLFVWTFGTPDVSFSYPQGLPELIDPSGGTITVHIDEEAPGELQASTAAITYETPYGSGTVPLVSIGGGDYQATFAGLTCGALISYYVHAKSANGFTWTDPPASTTRSERYYATAAIGKTVAFADDFETDQGWTLDSTINSSHGEWERVVPVATPTAPGQDYTPGLGSMCYVTDNRTSGTPGDGYNNFDVSGGPFILVSPVMDLSSLVDPFVNYARWFANDGNNQHIDDSFEVQVTSDGTNWFSTDRIGEPGYSFGWTRQQFRVTDYVSLTTTNQVRFIIADLQYNSGTEGAVDDFEVFDPISPAGYACPTLAECGLTGVHVTVVPTNAELGEPVQITVTNNSSQTLNFQTVNPFATVRAGSDCAGTTVYTSATGPIQPIASGANFTIAWNPVDDASQPLPAGDYSIEFSYLDAALMNSFTCCENLTLSTSTSLCNGDGGDQMGCTNCPCTNNAPSGTLGGCLNSTVTSARLLKTGSASVSLASGSTNDLRFALTGAPRPPSASSTRAKALRRATWLARASD